MNAVIVGARVGKGGRVALKALVPELKRRHNCSFCVANVENLAGGSGVTASCLKEIDGVADVLTAGDHVWDQKCFEKEIDAFKNFLRPANLSKLQPGRGSGVFRNQAGGEVAVIVLQGKIFMRESAYCPFETAEQLLAALPKTIKCVIVDIHAEATSEKAAMARFLDGKATLVFGTHTHVQTNDARVLLGGTAFISDVGRSEPTNPSSVATGES
jgi:metallophosphoesterase (TIGR00282 family)